MSTDLTFITNESGQTLRNRFEDLLRGHTRFFDCLVGYFYVSGFFRIYRSLESTEKVRILIGLSTDRKTFNLLQQAGQGELDLASHAEAKERLPTDILRELEQSDDTAELEDGVRKFIEWVRSGKMEVRVYPSEKIHAKIYVMTFVDGHIDAGRVITGSSNFSQAGLQDNLEFNVELKNRSDYEFALNKFNELWQHAVDVTETYVDTIEKKSPFAQFTPYELYLKLLYEYFRGELNRPEELEDVYLPTGFMKLRYQEEAVLSAKRVLDEYGGVFLSDVVGLGKTYMSAMLARELSGRSLVIAPPGLLHKANPGSWPNVFSDFHAPQTDFESIGKLDDLLKRDISKYANVFIDESHRFRTETNQTYEKLAQICRGKRVILVSATPLNNYPRDILSQVKLFQPGKNSAIPNARNLEAFFFRLEKQLKGLDRQADRDRYFAIVRANAKETREKVLKYLMIRRTRAEIEKHYGADMKVQGLKFPEVTDPEPLFYFFGPVENEVFNETVKAIGKITYARYKPLLYYTGEWPEAEKQGQVNLARFMKILLVKRLESSFHAFRLTLDRFIQSHERVVAEFKKGHVYISKKHIGKIFDYLDAGDEEAVEHLIEEEKADRLAAGEFTPEFLKLIENDLSLLHQIRDHWKKIKRDPKWTEFHKSLTTRADLQKDKLVIFSESKETVEYLVEKIREQVETKVVSFSGLSDEKTRETIIANFDARALHPKNDYRILVSTDVLAEGVNLHRAATVINYDIPWNPTRMMQRVGRINRIDTVFDRIRVYNFFPTEECNDLIKLKESAAAKIHSFVEMLGADARLLTEGEEIKAFELFGRLNSKKTITGEDEEEDTELEFLTEIRQVRDLHPDLFERIKHLPKKARSTRSEQAGSLHHNGFPALLTYFRQDRLDKFFLSSCGADILSAEAKVSCGAGFQPAEGNGFPPAGGVAFQPALTEPPLQAGSCILKNGIAIIVQNALLHFNGQRYALRAWCIMPNHVHVVLTPLGDNQLSKILHSWKSYSANEINKTLGKSGTVWERESFDHLIRTAEDLEKFTAYIDMNPVNAGLCDSPEQWPFGSCYAAKNKKARQAGPAFIEGGGMPFVPLKSRGELPHLHKEGATYFVTFRLWDAVVLKDARQEDPATSCRLEACTTTKEVDFLSAAKILRPTDKTEKRQAIPAEFYALLDKNKRAFVGTTTEDAVAAPGKRAGHSNDVYILHRLKARDIRHCKTYTEDDEEFIRQVVRLLEEGSLPRPTTKKVAEAIKPEVEPLRVLAHLRRNIPAEFLRSGHIRQDSDPRKPREVILSSWLVGKDL